MNSKLCTKCKSNKGFNEFSESKREADGLQDKCKTCNKLYRDANKLKIAAYKKQHYINNRQRILAYTTAHIKANLSKYSVYKANHRAAKLRSTPPWLTQEQGNLIKKIYENRPQGHHVDHIVPLQGKNVCGLHVPWNLQYLSASENIAKKNRF